MLTLSAYPTLGEVEFNPGLPSQSRARWEGFLGAALLDYHCAHFARGLGRIDLDQEAPQALGQSHAVVAHAAIAVLQRIGLLGLQRDQGATGILDEELLAPVAVIVGKLEVKAAPVVEGGLIDGEVALHPLVAQLVSRLRVPVAQAATNIEREAQRVARHRIQHLAALHRLCVADAQGRFVLVHGGEDELVGTGLGQIQPDVAR